MIKHTWTNRIAPPLVLLCIVSCVWYSVSNMPQAVTVTTAPAAATNVPSVSVTKSTAAAQQPIADVAPVVNKLGNTVSFSVDTKPFKQVQKVEFYVESNLIGAAFAAPYTVTISQDTLTAGTHTVTAKVYSGATAVQTTPALFTATPDKSAPPTAEDTDTVAPPPASAPAQASNLSSPTNVAASANTGGTAATITWSGVAGANGYQVWRDGTQVATTADVTYTDSNLSPGQTYDYYIVATSDSATSDPSTQVAVTMPVPQQAFNKPVNGNAQSTTPTSDPTVDS